MCLAVPGRVLEIEDRDDTRMARVDFGGVVKDVCLEYTPDMAVGDYAVVHVGFALQRLDEQSALDTLREFERMGELEAEFGDHWGRAATEAGLPRPEGTDSTPELMPQAVTEPPTTVQTERKVS
ncbi:MAG: HypC/HybG/HupF family hydrogenase formation chaperone [Geodermatophilaceae bacterium]|nr:HypC/HybG/HupF family hydrogenase formation chaperone [Geodermatophilaceae bacterium]